MSLFSAVMIGIAALGGELRGRWVLDAGGEPVRPREFERGLQPSGLLFRDGVLWSVGDQRAENPGHLIRIDLATARLIGAPLRMELPNPLPDDTNVWRYDAIRNPDFEGIAQHPRHADRLLAVTEDKRESIVEVELRQGAARILGITELDFPAGLRPHRDDPNYRVEGIAVSADGSTVYLAYERAADGLPRIFKLPLKQAVGGGAARPVEVAIDFAAVPPRDDKLGSLLNLNDIVTHGSGSGERLLAIARDQERLLVIDPARGRVTRVLDLHLRDPSGARIKWVSPEGIAIDPKTDRLWIINDPDSIRNNYKLEGEEAASGNFAALAPLLFEMPLSEVIPEG